MPIDWNNKKIDSLARAVLALRNKAEAKKFLRDLLTAGLSPRTIARISRWLNKGMGGYRLMINRLALHHHNSSPVGKGLR